MFMHAYAESHANSAGSQNRPGSGTNYTRPTSQQRRGNESMSSFYNRTGASALGPRSRGNLAPVRQVRTR